MRARLARLEHEVGRVFVLHQLPGLIDDQDALALVGFGLVPDVIQHNVHADRAQFVFQVADVEHHERVIDVEFALLAKDAGKGAGGVLAQALGQAGPVPPMCSQRVVQVVHSRRRGGVRQRIVGDAGVGVGVDQRGVQVGFFGRAERVLSSAAPVVF